MTTWGKAARQALLGGVCAVALSGCGTALWPRLQSDVVNNQTVVDGKTTNEPTMRGADAIANADFGTAMRYAYVSLDEITTMHQNAGDLSRGVGYLGTALGIGAGGAVLFDANTTILKALALAGASLLGLSDTANAAGQRLVLAAGHDAMACIIATGHAHNSAVNNLALALAALDVSTAAPAPSSLRLAAASSRSKTYIDTLPVAGKPDTLSARTRLAAMVNVPISVAESLPEPLPIPPRIETAREYVALKAVEAHNELREKTLNLLTTLAAQTANLPQYIVQSTWSIRAAVRKQLADTAPDPSGVINARRDAVINGAAELTAKAAATNKANKPGAATPGTGGGAAPAAPAQVRVAGGPTLDQLKATLEEKRKTLLEVDSRNRAILQNGTAEEKKKAQDENAKAQAEYDAAANAVRNFNQPVARPQAEAQPNIGTPGAAARLQLIAKLATEAVKPIDQVFQTCIDKATISTQRGAQDAQEEKK
jgi:hypothetical protein